MDGIDKPALAGLWPSDDENMNIVLRDEEKNLLEFIEIPFK